MRRTLICLLLTCTSLSAGPTPIPLMRMAGTAAYRPPKETVEILPKLEIGAHDGRMLYATIFRPRKVSEKPWPAIVFIHGGGWRSGSHYNPFSAWMAECGYLVASIDYRLSKEAPWPAQIQDCKLGIRWLRANAEKYHIDPDRIGTWGTSAGGQLAACVGVMQDVPELEGAGFEGVSSRVQAVGVFCGPSDFTSSDWKHLQHISDLFRVSLEENPGLWQSASPALAVRAGAPPFHIVHGEADQAVPISQGERLRDALQKSGSRVEWIPVKNGAHDFFVNPSTPESTIEPTREAIMQGLLDFFDTHLKNDPPGR